jgi:hypothetical protein
MEGGGGGWRQPPTTLLLVLGGSTGTAEEELTGHACRSARRELEVPAVDDGDGLEKGWGRRRL